MLQQLKNSLVRINSQYKSLTFYISLEDFSVFICENILSASTEYGY